MGGGVVAARLQDGFAQAVQRMVERVPQMTDALRVSDCSELLLSPRVVAVERDIADGGKPAVQGVQRALDVRLVSEHVVGQTPLGGTPQPFSAASVTPARRRVDLDEKFRLIGNADGGSRQSGGNSLFSGRCWPPFGPWLGRGAAEPPMSVAAPVARRAMCWRAATWPSSRLALPRR